MIRLSWNEKAAGNVPAAYNQINRILQFKKIVFYTKIPLHRRVRPHVIIMLAEDTRKDAEEAATHLSSALSSVLLACFALDIHHRSNVDPGMNRKINDQLRQIDVAVTSPLTRILPKKRHQASRPFEEPFREDVIVKGKRLERRSRLGVE